MHRCLALAAQGQGLVGNGAKVGAVLVREGRIIAEGWHREFGLAHAERDLLERFNNEVLPTDTLCVNLEPCCHTAKTPPCTDIVIERGVKSVVIGMADPDQRMQGSGITQLRAAGISVVGTVLEPVCRRMNRGFVSVRTKHRPFLTLKHAYTLDGRIANADGSPLQITSPEQDVWAHTHLRAQHDAILVGVGTVITDDPQLDTRFDIDIRGYQPWRIILDPQGRIPRTAKVLTDAQASKTMIVVAGDSNLPEISPGPRVFPVPMAQGHFVWGELWRILTTPHDDFHGITSILVEGGRTTWNYFKAAGMVDEEVVMVG